MMFPRINLVLVCAALAGGILAGCNPETQTPAARQADIGFEHRFALKIGARNIRAQVALSEIEKSAGLMYRKTLGENEGMLFVFPANAERSFWMRNVPINIDIAYLTEDGKINEILTLYAEDPSSAASKSRQIRYALEMPEKWFAQTSTKVGDRLDMTGVRDAIKTRGYLPDQFLPATTTAGGNSAQ